MPGPKAPQPSADDTALFVIGGCYLVEGKANALAFVETLIGAVKVQYNWSDKRYSYVKEESAGNVTIARLNPVQVAELAMSDEQQ